jgi:hypothetical protein
MARTLKSPLTKEQEKPNIQIVPIEWFTSAQSTIPARSSQWNTDTPRAFITAVTIPLPPRWMKEGINVDLSRNLPMNIVTRGGWERRRWTEAVGVGAHSTPKSLLGCHFRQANHGAGSKRTNGRLPRVHRSFSSHGYKVNL